jgi:integrase
LETETQRAETNERHQSEVWLPALAEAGIEWTTWHDLRHTFASRLAMNGQNEGTIAALLRHSTTALVKRYAHLSPSHLKAAVEGVAGFGKAPAPLRVNQIPVEKTRRFPMEL